MEATHHEHEGHEHLPAHRQEDWFDDEFAKGWIERQKDREPERMRQFQVLRALVTNDRDDEFRYLNLGAGPGNLDEVLLAHFPNAEATLLDGSMAMLSAARKRLARYQDRVELVQADLAGHDWPAAAGGPFDLIVSSIAIHNLREPRLIRAVYAEAFKLLGHGGMFLNLDYVRPPYPSLAPLARWAAQDHDAGFTGGGGANHAGTLNEQLGWLTEAGFGTVDVLWKQMNTVVLCGIRDHLHLPHSFEAHDHAHEHGHEEHGHEHTHEDEHNHDHHEHQHEGHSH